VRSVVLDAEGIVDMDITGAETLTALFDDLDRRAIGLVLASVRTSVLTTLRRLGLEDRLGARNIHLSIRGAVSGVTGQAGEPMDPALVPEPRAARGSSPVGEDHAGAEADASKTDR
jgi:hypothetical protein